MQIILLACGVIEGMEGPACTLSLPYLKKKNFL